MAMPTPEDFEAFPVGTRVRLVPNKPGGRFCSCDFVAFDAGETGIVVANSQKYLGIQVKLDNTEIVGIGDTWGFNPQHLQAE